MHCNFASYVCASSLPAFPQIMIGFRQDCITFDAANFTCSSHLKRPHMKFICVTCSLPVKTGNYTCFYAASTSRKIPAMAVNKARKMQVTSPAWCRLTYLQFAGEFNRGVVADCLQLQLILRGIAGFLPAIVRLFVLAFAVIFACVWRVFLPAILVFLPVSCMYFTCRSRQLCMLVAGKFAWVPHVKLPVKCLWYSGKFTYTRSQFACVLREVLAASKQLNLPVFTGKLHVTQVNCGRDLFTCELHANLPAFAGNFARASFTVYETQKKSLTNRYIFSKIKYLNFFDTTYKCWTVCATPNWAATLFPRNTKHPKILW